MYVKSIFSFLSVFCFTAASVAQPADMGTTVEKVTRNPAWDIIEPPEISGDDSIAVFRRDLRVQTVVARVRLPAVEPADLIAVAAKHRFERLEPVQLLVGQLPPKRISIAAGSIA